MALPQTYNYVCRSIGLGGTDVASPSYNGGIATVMFQAVESQNVQSRSFVTLQMTNAAAADFTVGDTYALRLATP
jgi:hypothetical protein